MIPTKEQMREVFHDTLEFFDEDSILHESILTSAERTKIYPADFAVETE